VGAPLGLSDRSAEPAARWIGMGSKGAIGRLPQVSARRRRIGVGKNRLLVELLLGETAAPQQQPQGAHADGEQAGEPEREARVAERDACVEELGRTVKRQSAGDQQDRKSTRLNSSHVAISYAVF